MSQTRILEMLEKGTITADEAAKLLEAIAHDEGATDTADATADAGDHEPIAVEPDQITLGSFEPDAKRWNRFRQIPFAVAITVLVISAWGLYALYRQADARITFGWLAVLVLFLFSILATVVTFWMLRAPWMHVRIEERDGKRIAISLPLPLTLANWGLQIARRYVDEQTAEYLDTSTEFLKVMRQGHGKEAKPVMVDIDEDGQRVQVYIG
jgi:hypothetical protein